MNEKEKLRDLVLQKEKEGKIVLSTFDGLIEADLEEFIKQPVEGLLYDLNRDRATVLTFIDDPKWINDYAVGLVIAKLKEKIANQALTQQTHCDDESWCCEARRGVCSGQNCINFTPVN